LALASGRALLAPVRLAAITAAALIFAIARPALAGDVVPRPSGPTEPHVQPTWIWALAELVPSPEVVAINAAPHAELGLRWQLTPVYFATSLRSGLSPWRSFVVEPRLRAGGGVELYVAPELVTIGPKAPDDFYLRLGLRSYFPLIEHGESMSCSIGTMAVIHSNHVGTAIEGGIYTLAGIWGLQVAYVPTPTLRTTTVTLALRYF
jgi:hypothetical protein